MRPQCLGVRSAGKLVLIGTLAGGLITGCGSEDSPTGPDVPGGGQERILDYDVFVAQVAPVLTQEGCDAGGDCHGGGIRGTFALSPDHNKDLRFDFQQAIEQVDDLTPVDSALLRKPLAEAAGGDVHSATAFAATSDAGYQSILAWIEAGELRP